MTASQPSDESEDAGSPPLPVPAPGSQLRASDADRDRVADVLRDAAGEGRLTLEELEQRLNAVYSARTYAELEPITRDLPVPGGTVAPPAPVHPATAPVEGAPSWRSGIGILAAFQRLGVWTVPRTFTAITFWGGGKIDLRDARFAAGEARIRAFAIMGGIEVIVPEDLTVHVKGLPIMGGFDPKASGPGVPGAPRVTVSGFSFWGGVTVKRKARRERGKKAKKERRD